MMNIVNVTMSLSIVVKTLPYKHLELAKWANVGIMDEANDGQIEYSSCQSGTVSQ